LLRLPFDDQERLVCPHPSDGHVIFVQGEPIREREGACAQLDILIGPTVVDGCLNGGT
jgi:hypothetical protein